MNWWLLAAPFKSRKVQTAIATVLVAYLAEWGLNVPTEIIISIVGVGISVILGIAHEDAAQKKQPPEK